MNNQLTVNPGFAGNSGMINVLVGNRQQWVGLEDAPSTTVFGVDTEMDILGWNSGLGLQIRNDQAGQINTLNLALVYAKRWSFESGKLGVGLSFGMVNQAFKYGELETNPSKGGNSYQTDEEFVNDEGSAMDLGIGGYFEGRKYYLGLSVAHLNQPRPNLKQGYKSFMYQTYFLTVGYKYKLKKRQVDLRPSLFVIANRSSAQINLNCNAVVKENYWGGLTYRFQDAIVVLGGVELNNGLQIGYSYDLNLTKLKDARSGSHEIMLGYTFDLSIEKKKRKYKSVRYL